MTGPVTGIRRRRGVAGRRETPHLPLDRDFYGQTLISENKLMQMKNTETMAYATPKTGSEANGARNSMAIPAIANITRKNANISIVELEFVVALHISFVRRAT